MKRINEAMDELGNPNENLPPVIHFAGTNGKGSTLAFLRSILEANNKKVHCYTSPHLVEFNERFLVASKQITDAQIGTVAKKLGTTPLTFFEAATSVAFLLFSHHKADYTLLETGLGGRFDATNIIPPPKVAVITPISVDHTKHLGSKVSSIAFEKAGIIKAGSKVVVARQSYSATKVLEQRIAEQKCTAFMYRRDWALKNNAYVRNGLTLPLAPSLKGIHQYMNAATAAAVADLVLGIDATTIAKGISSATWQGRLHQLQLKNRKKIWLDGAHNEAGVKSFAATLAQWKPMPTTLIIGLTGARSPKNFLLPFIKNKINVRRIMAVEIPNAECVEPAKIVKSAKALGFTAEATSLQEAVNSIESDTRGVVFGSLYLVGAVLASAQNKSPQSQENSVITKTN